MQKNTKRGANHCTPLPFLTTLAVVQLIFFLQFLLANDSQDGELVRTGNAILKAEITSADGSRTAEAEVADNKNGTYEVGYTLHSEGEYSFALMLYGQPIRGSPFRLRAVKPSDVPQSPDDVKRRVKSPSGTGGHIRQKAVRRPASMYSTTKKKENPIEDELIYRVGKREGGVWRWRFRGPACRIRLDL